MSEPVEGPGDPQRREILKWMGVVMLAAGAVGDFASAARAHRRGAAGYGMDPNLVAPAQSPWPLTLTPRQRAAARGVMDVILPGDAGAPAASTVGLVDFLDEWVSAPYPDQRADAALLVPMLDEIDRESLRRFGKGAGSSSCAEIESLAAGLAQAPAFRRLCILAAAAYYTSHAGFAAIGFVGNEPRTSFDGPPAQVLADFELKMAHLAAD